MEKKQFMFVIDTTESTQLINLQRGIVNAGLIQALDERHAVQLVLRTVSPQVASQIASSVYVYPVAPLLYAIDNADKNGGTLPMFSFMPLNGARPQRILNLPNPPKQGISESEAPRQQISVQKQSVVQPQQQVLTEQQVRQPVVQQPQQRVVRHQVDIQNARQVRSSSFQNSGDEPMGVTSDNVTREQAQILASLGAIPQRNGGNEGANPRINASTGRNLNLSEVQPSQGPRDGMTADQLAILRSVGADSAQTILVDDDIEKSTLVTEDQSLSQVEGGALSEEQILALQSEFKQEIASVGVDIPDSVPQEQAPNVSIELRSTIDQKIREKVGKV